MKLNNKNYKKRTAPNDGEKSEEIAIAKRGKIATNALYKPPTVEELNTLRETEILFNSNLFRLQTEELIRAVFVKQKRIKAVEAWIEKFQKLTEKLPEYSDNKLSDFNLCLDKTETPQKLKSILKQIAKNNPLDLKCDLNAAVKLIRPKSNQIVGLFNANAVIGPSFAVTLNVVMPKECFQDKDYLNARYLVKRALYLSYIATYLQKENICHKIQYSCLNGNYLIPVICVQPENIRNAIITISVTPEEHTFKPTRFASNKNNVRSKYFSACSEHSITTENTSPTLFYNSIILNDVTLIANEEFNCANVKGLKGVSEGLILLIVWLRQRELNQGFGAFTEGLLYSVVSRLVVSGKLNKHMSSYQVIRNVWNYFEQSEWTLSDGQQTKQPEFLDCTGHYNLAANLDVNIYRRVKHEAQLALLYLNEGKFTSFQTLFMTKMDFYLQFDVLINIEHSNALLDLYSNIEDDLKIDYLTNKLPVIQKYISKTLQTGLTDRVSIIVPKLQPEVTWDLGSSASDGNSLCFGIHLNSSNMFKIVDKGPAAYEASATEFRDFWGSKSELRRFKDGSISEAVYWEARQTHQKRVISKRIIDFVLKDKLKLQEFSVVYDQFESILQLYKAPECALEEGNLKVVQVFDDLAKKLRDLNLPLSISNIQGTAQAFCHSDAYPPIATSYSCGKKTTREIRNQIVFKDDINLKISPHFVPSITAIVEMVHHSKWPNDAEAMRNLRTAFYLQIAEQLIKDDADIRTNVCHEHLDILYRGFVFRIVLFHPKEVSLIKKHQDERGIISFRDTPQSLKLEKDFCIVPRVIGALNGVHSRCPTFGPGTILMKRWLNSQLLDDWHVPEVVVGLLSASLYLDCAPFQMPRLPQLAFIRFLALLVRFPFTVQPLFVNFNEEISKEERDKFESKFQALRTNFPPLCIITPFDQKSFLTSNAPTQEILYRITVLAKESLDTIEKNIHSQTLFDSMVFFKPNYQGYNVIIHLQPFLNPTRNENLTDNTSTIIDNKIEPYDEKIKNKMPIVDFHPVQLYLNELRKNYNHFALFFYDSYGGNIISVLWKPIVFEKQDFKISEVEGKKLIENEKLKVNIDAIVEDFHLLGDGIVKNIEIL